MDEVVGTFHFWDSFRMELLEHLWMNMVYNMVKMTAFRHVFSGVSPCLGRCFGLGKKISVIPGLDRFQRRHRKLRRYCAVRKAPAPRGVRPGRSMRFGRRVTGWRDAAGWWKSMEVPVVPHKAVAEVSE